MKISLFLLGAGVGAIIILYFTKGVEDRFKENPVAGKLEVISVTLMLIALILSGFTVMYFGES